MKTTAWGSQGLEASVEGLGAMGMSAFYGGRDDAESAATLHRALDLGVSMIDTAEMYGPFLNERLIGQTIGSRSSEYALATKTGVEITDDGERRGVNGSPAYLRKALERSLRNLGRETIDLYYIHRVDPDVPIEETFGAMGELVTEGKVRYLGISEAAPETIRRAHATHPLTAVQTEYSLFERAPEVNGVLDTTRELGIEFVAYSPLGRGVLTGAISSANDLEDGDFRRSSPRFTDDNLAANLTVVDQVRGGGRAQGHHARPAGPGVGPAPGGRRRDPRHQAADLSGGERRGGRRGADPRRAGRARRDRPRRCRGRRSVHEGSPQGPDDLAGAMPGHENLGLSAPDRTNPDSSVLTSGRRS